MDPESEGAGLDDRFSGGRPGAPGGAAFPDEDAFDLAEDGEDVFEWVGGDEEQTGERERAPRRTPREVLAQLKALRTDRRGAARRGLIGVGAGVLTAALAAGGTAWFDTVARGADYAQVTNLALDAVTDGDPAVSHIDAATASGTAQYVLEIANNGPAAVTLTGVSVDAGTMMTSTGWQPLGPARIAPGGVGKVAVTVHQDCELLMFGQAVGGAGRQDAVTFPTVAVSVRATNGDLRTVMLSARQRNPSVQVQTTNSDTEAATPPQVTTASSRECLKVLYQRFLADPGNLGTGAVDPGPQVPGGDPVAGDKPLVTATYVGVKQAANPKRATNLDAPTYVLGFRAHNASQTAVRMAGGADTAMKPIEVPAGGDADFTVTVTVTNCHDRFFAGISQTYVMILPESAASPGDFSIQTGQQFSPLSQLLSGSQIPVTLDELAQRKAACP